MTRKPATIDTLPKLFDESRRPIYAIDAERRIVYCNPALSAWLDITASRIIGRVVEYHSESTEGEDDGREPAPLTDLCPPPRALAGEPCWATLSCMGRGGRLVHRQAEFVPLAMSHGAKAPPKQDQRLAQHFAVFVLLADADLSTQDVAAQLSGEPTVDELHRTIRRFRSAQANRYSIESLLGSSAAMQKVRAQVAAAAASGANVLIYGPRGSGRGHVARAIHYSAQGATRGKLVPVDCEALTDDLLRRVVESLRTRPEEGGQRPTLLFENLDGMLASHQSVLCAAICQMGFSARLIATSNSKHTLCAVIETEHAQGDDGRADGTPTRHPAIPAAGCQVPATVEPALLDAISIITIEIPPLADRLEDLPILAQFFLETCNRGNDKQIGSLRSDALDRLALYSWPGELVQLRETIAAAHRTCSSHEISLSDLPNIIRHAFLAATSGRRPERIILDELLASIEKEVIVRALAQTSGNKSEAATLLGMTRPRLYRRLVQLGLAGESGDQQPEQPEFIERETTD